MRRRAMWPALTLGALVGVVAEAGAAYLVCGRRGQAVGQATRRGRRGRRRGRGQDREADVLEGAPDDARADDLRREAAPELERAAAEAARDQAHREEVARQVEDVLHVVAEPDLRDHLVEDALEILALEPDRAADAKVEAGVLGERRGR